VPTTTLRFCPQNPLLLNNSNQLLQDLVSSMHLLPLQRNAIWSLVAFNIKLGRNKLVKVYNFVGLLKEYG
jgi:hypothetical protein